MQTIKAKELAGFIKEAYFVFGKTFHHNIEDENELEGYKQEFTDDKFSLVYNEFEEELKLNIEAYQNIKQIYAYIKGCLFEIYVWEPFYNNDDEKIISQGYEMEFLLKLKQRIERYAELISRLCETDKYGEPESILVSIINKHMNKTMKLNKSLYNKSEPVHDERFDFEKMMMECTAQEMDTLARIIFINDRLAALQQWQTKYDIEIDFGEEVPDNTCKFQYTAYYYPNFENQCAIELKRLEKKNEIEKKIIVQKVPEFIPAISPNAEPSLYNWEGSDTDLLELIVALIKTETISRKDSKKVTQKELVETFKTLFGIELKGVKSKLTNAVGRKKSTTPFLDNLKKAFEAYINDRAK